MTDVHQDEVVEELVSSPGGAALLAALEVEARTDVWWGDWNGDSSPEAVTQAAADVESASFNDICHQLLHGTSSLCPWDSGSEHSHQRVALQAESRRPIAEALVTAHHTRLVAGLDTSRQQEYHMWRRQHTGRRPALFESYEDVYGAGADYDLAYGRGQFTWNALRTTTSYDNQLTDAKFWATDYSEDDVDRWLLTVRGQPSVYEIRRFDDWRMLIDEYGRTTSDGRRAPNWATVAEHYDAVHLTWLGLVIAHSHHDAAQSSGVITLNYWFDEQTHWLHNCFERAEIVGPAERSVTLEVLPAMLDLD